MDNLVHYDYYLVGKPHQKAVDQIVKSHNSFWRKINKFKKKVKATGMLHRTFGLERTVVAFTFKKPPSPAKWKQVFKDSHDNAYWPRGNTLEGKALLEELIPIRKWTSHELSDAVGYKWLYIGDRVFPFNAGVDFKKKIAYFSIPAIPPTQSKPKDWYEPVRGVKKISYEKLTKVLGAKV